MDARQLGVDVAGVGEQGEEGAAVVGIAAAGDVGEAVAVAADVAHQVGVRFADGRVLLQVLEEFPRLVGVLCERRRVAQGEFAVLAGVVSGQRDGRLRRLVVGFDVAHDALVDAADAHAVLVVVLH